jgi:hypothetical protein
VKKLLPIFCAFVSVIAMSAKAEISVLGLDAGQLRVMELESIPPWPDEFVLSGTRQRYGVGESFVVPKGWTGTWDMPVKYREKIVVERKAWDESEG